MAAPATGEVVELTTSLTEGAGALAGSSTNATWPGDVSATLKATAEAPAEAKATAEAPAEAKVGVPLEKAGGLLLCVAACPASRSRQAACSHRRGVTPRMLTHVRHRGQLGGHRGGHRMVVGHHNTAGARDAGES